MAKRISLSRAARLVGVKRGTLQQQIRAGELATFEGEIVLSDLLQAYPNARIEDSSMLERVEQIIEQATFVNPQRNQNKPDKVALMSRIMSLGRELESARRKLAGYRQLSIEFRQKLDDLDQDSAIELKSWLEKAEA